MIHTGAMPFQIAINASSATAAGTITSSQIDTLQNGIKMESVSIAVIAATSNVVSNVPTVFKLQECDTTVTSSFVDVVPFVGGTATSATVGFLIPTTMLTATSLQPYAVLNVDLKGRKRYLSLVISPATTQIFTAIAAFGRPAQITPTAAGLNANGFVVAG
jgi:hypothetical protein